MPIYEFHCPHCNRVFNFLARSAAAARRKPACPRCGRRRMHKLLSRFGMITGGRRGAGRSEAEGGQPGDRPGAGCAEEARMEREMMRLAREMESIDAEHPRQLAAAMRRLSAVTGEPLDGQTDEMIRRLEAGEDPQEIEEKMGAAFGDEDSGGASGAPTYDDGLYDL